MKRFLFAVAVLVHLGACRTANLRDPADRVREIDQSRFRAMVANNLETLATVLADDLVYIHSDGEVDSKEEFLQHSSQRIASVSVDRAGGGARPNRWRHGRCDWPSEDGRHDGRL
jgi:hypothetical protein